MDRCWTVTALDVAVNTMDWEARVELFPCVHDNRRSFVL